MAKKSIASKMRAAQEELKRKMRGEDDDKKERKKYRKSAREQYKELRESRKEKEVKASNTYEQDLIKSLFDNKSEVVSEVVPSSIDLGDNEKPQKSHGNEIWDYTLDDEITFFDPECSYELTGYKPITETKGLDFNPEWFTEAGKTYTETGYYTEYPKGSKPYADYWDEQLRRCREGCEINGYRLTGDHYFFLNFYRMNTVDDTKKAASGDTEGFPKFLVEQYKFFHYFEMCEYLKKDVVALKSRGIK